MSVINKKGKITSHISQIDENKPIFAMKGGKYTGMLVREVDGWILRTGGWRGFSGHYDSREDLIFSCSDFFEFHIDLNPDDS